MYTSAPVVTVALQLLVLRSVPLNLLPVSGDDVLIGGSVANQDSLEAIDQALASWSTGNLNATLLYLGLMTDDLEKDELSGDAGIDQLFGGVGDKLKQ